MAATPSEIWKQLASIWSRLGVNQRFTAILVVLGTLCGIAAIVWLAGRPDYQDLQGGLSSEDLQEVSAALGEAGVRYSINGALVRVDSRDVTTARNALAKKGIPSGGAGIKDLEGAGNLTLSKPLMNFKMQLVSAQMAEQMIVRIHQVRSAKVKCFFPEQRLFIGEKGDARATANVTISLRPGTSLSQVGSAVVTVVSDGLGIPRENVSVVDSTGAIYSDSRGMDQVGAPMDREALALDRMESESRTQRAQQALEQIWPGKTVVRVDVKLDLTRETSQEKILPPDKVLLREKKTEKTTVGGTAAGGDPSVAAVATGTTGVLAAPPGKLPETKSLDTEKTWLDSVGERRTSRLAPQIKRMTVSLAVDKTIGDKQKDIEEFVKQTVGWDETRSDKVTNTVVEFPPEEAVPAQTVYSFLERLKEYASPAAQVISVALALFFLKRMLKRSRKAGPLEVTPQSAAGTEAGPEQEMKKVRKEIEKVVAADPAAVTRLLQNWLTERS